MGTIRALLRLRRRVPAGVRLLAAVAALWAGTTAALAGDLDAELGRSEVRVRSAPSPLLAGRSIRDLRIVEGLELRGYRRVHHRPEVPGEYFWGHERFWIFRRAHRFGGRNHPAALIGLRLERGSGTVLGGTTVGGVDFPLDGGDGVWLEPVTLSESLDGTRARRRPLDFEGLPEHVWRAVLAAEDHRFFDHPGVDSRSVARALVANLREGKVVQGGSTITQQLVKNRDLTPERTFTRKVREAIRALALEAEHGKVEILGAYLDSVYLGHVEGLAVHGFGAAAEVYFSKSAEDLDLAQAALLAAMIRGPNRLAPDRHPGAAKARRNWILERMAELGWADPGEIDRARARPLDLDRSPPEPGLAPRFVAWSADVVAEEAPRRARGSRGIVVETTLDPVLQRLAEAVVGETLDHLRRRRGPSVSMALVALEAGTGDVLASVGGDPAEGPDSFDRARSARRQPGSAVKPLLLLEAFEECGPRDPLTPASRIADEPLVLELESGPWAPENPGRRSRGEVTVREALVDSLNVPFVRLARWCGFEETATTLRRAGLDLPSPVPPSFALGAVETTPSSLASAYTTFPGLGLRAEPRPVRRLEAPGGRRVERIRPARRRVASPETAYLVAELLRQAAEDGTARGAAIDGVPIMAKTGTSSDRRDAWLAGSAGGIVTVVWVGRDDGAPLGLGGAGAAAPAWRDFMAEAVPIRPRRQAKIPEGIVERWVDSRTGLLVREWNPRARREIFRRDALPRRDRFWRIDEPVPVVR